jgi:hypothetical protein
VKIFLVLLALEMALKKGGTYAIFSGDAFFYASTLQI